MRCEHHDSDTDSVSVTLHFDSDELTLRPSPFGLAVELAGMSSGGDPGGPALPQTQMKVAVPQSFWPQTLEIVDEKWETVVERDAFVRPVQHLRAGTSGGGGDAPVHCADDCSCRSRRPVRHSLTNGLPVPEYAVPEPSRYEAAAADPVPVAHAVRIETVGTTHLAVIALHPVRLTPHGELRLCTEVRLRIDYTHTPPMGDRAAAHRALSARLGREIDIQRIVPEPHARLTGAAELTRITDVVRGEVLNPHIIGDIGDRLWPYLDLPCEYLIITDDCTWDAETIRAGGGVPGMIAQFERLAAAKRARGVSARVVTISDIVAGRFGDYRTGSRDLQEVLRKFVKHARNRWGVSWLLLGGDTDVVPVREVAGAFEGHVSVDTKSDPDDNKSYWTGSYLKMHVVSPGTWWSGGSPSNLLVRPDTGQLIPYDSIGTSSAASPGWYFTADDYSTRSAMPTDYVRVNAPASLANATLQFLYTWNTLPTDFYYASLDSYLWGTQRIDMGWFSFEIPYVYVPEHDWDVLDNGVYGQHLPDGTDLDGVVLRTDVSVGRAPVESAAQATNFVDKVLAYEGLRMGTFSHDASRWPTRMVIASTDWGGRAWFSATNNAVPDKGQYHADLAANTTLLRRDGVPDSFDYELISHISDTDRRILPFKTDTNSAVRGWYYAKSASDLSLSGVTFSLPWTSTQITFPMPSEWIVVHGPLDERTPAAFEHDPTGEDGSMSDQEQLRGQIVSELPGINDFHRLYEDEFDLTFPQRVAAPVDYLTSANLTAALNNGPHFMSLSGHGSPDGCCGGSIALARSLTNGLPGFIGYADSCLTNRFDGDAFSEELVNNPSGGAVAYVGNTRFSWIGVGDNFQRAFFHRLVSTRHLGLLNDSRISVYGTTGYYSGYERWAIFTLNLLGDPELQVYRNAVPWIPLTVDHHLGRIVGMPDLRPVQDYPSLTEKLVGESERPTPRRDGSFVRD